MDASVLDPTMKVSATDGLCHHCAEAPARRRTGRAGLMSSDRFHELHGRGRRRKIPRGAPGLRAILDPVSI